jgi:hypothetical protein
MLATLQADTMDQISGDKPRSALRLIPSASPHGCGMRRISCVLFRLDEKYRPATGSQKQPFRIELEFRFRACGQIAGAAELE